MLLYYGRTSSNNKSKHPQSQLTSTHKIFIWASLFWRWPHHGVDMNPATESGFRCRKRNHDWQKSPQDAEMRLEQMKWRNEEKWQVKWLVSLGSVAALIGRWWRVTARYGVGPGTSGLYGCESADPRCGEEWKSWRQESTVLCMHW